MRIPRLMALLMSTVVVACGSSDDDDGFGPRSRGASTSTVDPSDPNALSAVITIPGAVRVQGQPPTQTGDGPSIQTSSSGLSVDSGGQAIVEVDYQGEAGYTDCIVQVQGADDYFEVGVSEPILEGQIRIPVNIPESVDTGSFSLYTCVVDAFGGVSNPISSAVSVTGSIASPPPTSNPPSNPPGGGDDICSGQQVSAECTLEYCVSPDASDCYYVVDGRRINCPGCATSSCVEQAVNACLN